MNSILEEPTTTPEPEEPPLSYDEAKLKRLVFETPPGQEEPIKTKTKRDNKEYMRQYYHKHKADIVCPFCNISYTCKSSLNISVGAPNAQYNVSTTPSLTSPRRVFVIEITYTSSRWKKVLRCYRD